MAIWWRHLAVILSIAIGLWLSSPVHAATTGQFYWCDVRTGYAIGGFDPVAYFVESEPRQGSKEFEFDWQGVTWRFVNAANRAVFARDPNIYAPQFGGYGTVRIKDGSLIEGSPFQWVIYKQRLFFFSTSKRRESWLAEPQGQLDKAIANWPGLNRNLVRE